VHVHAKFIITEASETTLVHAAAAYWMRKVKNFDHCARTKIRRNSEREERVGVEKLSS